jgi:hypothetical protein
MRIRAIVCFAVLLAACDSAQIAAPVDVAKPAASTSLSSGILHGDGSETNPYYYVLPGEWVTTYSFTESSTLYEGDAAPCPPMYRQTLWLRIDVANVGWRKILVSAPVPLGTSCNVMHTL